MPDSFAAALHYRIHPGVLLAPTWSEWLGGLTLGYQGDTTIIEGELADQAALYTLIDQTRDLDLPIYKSAF